MSPAITLAQADVQHWIMNLNGKLSSYWENTASPGSPPDFIFINATDSADVLKMCYNADSVWVRANGLTNDMGQFLNPGTCIAQNYVFRIPRNPVVDTTARVTSPKVGAIGVLLNGIPIYGLSNSYSWNGTANEPGMGGSGIWNVEVGISEGFVLDTAFGAHPQQNGAYHTHCTPFRFYRNAPAGHHSPLVGYAFDGYPVYGPYGYTNAMDSTSGVTRMKSGYSLRSITTRTSLPYGVSLTPSQYGPDVSTTYPIGYYCEDYEWLSTNGGDLDQYNGRFCITPEYPSGTYAYFVTVDASGAAQFPYYIGIQYYGMPDQANFGIGTAISMPASALECLLPETNGVPQVNASASGFSLYPNPSTGHISITSATGAYTNVSICNEIGNVVYTAALSNGNMDADLSLPTGVYFVTCSNSATKKTTVKSLVME